MAAWSRDTVSPLFLLQDSTMSDQVQTTSDSLCKLVRWAHSHGTICNLIPSLQHPTTGSYRSVPAPEPGHHGSGIPVAVWGCSAGHAYHWPLSDHGNGSGGSANTGKGQERFVGGRPSNKVKILDVLFGEILKLRDWRSISCVLSFFTFQVTVRASCDLSCSEAASEGEEFSSRLFDIAGCDSSATDDDDDYEPHPPRKRGGAPGGTVAGKKVKQEETSAEDFNIAVTDAVSLACQATPDTHCEIAHTLLPSKPLPPSSQHVHGQAVGDEGSVDPEPELLGGRSCTTGSTEHSKRCSSATETTGQTAGTALL